VDLLSRTDEEKMKLANSSIVLDIDTPSSEFSTPRAPLYHKADRNNYVGLQLKIPAPPSSPSDDRKRRSSAAEWLAMVNKRQLDLTNLQKFCKSKITTISRDGSTKLTKSSFCELFSNQVCVLLLIAFNIF